MKDPLARLIERLKKDISSYAANEAAIKQGMVLSILGQLGWDITNVREEVVPEYSTGKGRVDYCLISGGQSRVFIEVKGLTEDLEAHQEQLLRYAFEEGIELSILTNGRSWWLYLPTLPGHWEQRKFYAIDLEKQEVQEITKNLRELLSKDAVATSSALQRARALHEGKERERKVSQALPEAWHRLINEPDGFLVELLAETVLRLCGHKPELEIVNKFLITEATQPPTPLETMLPIPSAPRKTIPKQKGAFAHKKISGFELFGEKRSVKTFKALLVGVCEILSKRHSSEFHKVFSYRGRKRLYFSKNPLELRNAERIPDLNIHVETNLSADNIVQMCRRILGLFGHSPTDLKINLRQ
ncbi:MAG: type I restriction enzyme HsdR N-terminal domain-containing protein [Nitrospinae bacterium]|nr:type I restriction enzyme HsdR N-terminal domain-containing protein [Nitrospinota bacterium]